MSVKRFLSRFFLLSSLILVVSVAGQAVYTDTAAAATVSCSPSGTTYGTDTLSISIPASTTYTIWTRLQIPSSTDNAVLLNVGGSCYDVGANSSLPTNAWEWVDYDSGSTSNAISLSLSTGSHTLEYTGTNPSVKIDRVLAIPSSDGCTPTGTGNNCTEITSSSTPTTSTGSSSSTSSKGASGTTSSSGTTTPSTADGSQTPSTTTPDLLNGNGMVAIMVTDSSGAPVKNAKVSIDNRYTGYTDSQGEADFSNISAGTYTVVVTSQSEGTVRTKITVGANQTKPIAIKLVSAKSSWSIWAGGILVVLIVGGVAYWIITRRRRPPQGGVTILADPDLTYQPAPGPAVTPPDQYPGDDNNPAVVSPQQYPEADNSNPNDQPPHYS